MYTRKRKKKSKASKTRIRPNEYKNADLAPVLRALMAGIKGVGK